VKLAAFADERGMSLVETLVTVALVSIILAAFLAAVSVGSFGVSVVRERVTAENLARAQLEHIKNYTYTVGAIVDNPNPEENDYPIIEHREDYPITIDISYWYSATMGGGWSSNPDHDRPCGMQWITVTVSHNGVPVFRALDYKLNR
jgi:prepilin-type N-terminal cleavage/methylation domain-containing protein